MAIKTPSYFKWRDGRPRWEPGPGVRAKGFQGKDLKDEGGQWLPLGQAIAAAEALNAEVKAWDAEGGGHAGRRPPQRRRSERTAQDLYERWTATPEFRMLAASTRADYESKARVFLAEFGAEPLAAIKRTFLKNFWRQMYADRGHAMANGVIAVVRAMLTFAVDEEWISHNPAYELGLKSVPPRVVVWTPSEAQAFVEIGDGLGLLQAVDAVVIALYTGQRQGDVLALHEPTIETTRIYLRQSKTGARVGVPFTDQLARRFEDIRRRRLAKAVVGIGHNRDPLFMRPDGKPYDEYCLRRDFGRIRYAVAQVFPEFAEKRYQDLRDTAVTRLALAGCTIIEIAAITGHSLETIHQVLKHYLAIDDKMAQAGIDRLKVWMREEGIAI